MRNIRFYASNSWRNFIQSVLYILQDFTLAIIGFGGSPLVQKIAVDKVSVEWSKSADEIFLSQTMINPEEWRKISIEVNFFFGRD